MIRAALSVTPLSNKDGLWCDPCARSTAVQYVTAITLAGCPSLVTRTVCRRCGAKTT